MAAPIVTRLVLNTKGFTKGVNVAGKGLGKLAGAAGGVLGLITKLGLAFTAFGGIVSALIIRQAQFIDRLGKVSDVIGVNIETLQKFRFAAEQSGISIEQADVALRRFSRRLGEAQKGTGELLPALRRLGIETQNADGSFKSAEQVLLEFADGVANTSNESAKLSLAFKAFDSEGAELVQTLNEGADGLKAFFDEAESLGVILDRETVAGVEDFNDSLNKLQTLIGGVANIFVAELAPALTEVTERFIEFVKSFKDEEGSFKDLGTFLKDQFIDALVIIVKTVETVINVLGSLTNQIIRLGNAVGLSGIPEMGKASEETGEKLGKLQQMVRGFTRVNPTSIQQSIDSLRDLGFNVEELQSKLDKAKEDAFLGGILGVGMTDIAKDVRQFMIAALETVQEEYNRQTDVFKGADFTSLIQLLLGNKSDVQTAVEDTTTAIEEVVVVAQEKLGIVTKILRAMFGKEKVSEFWDYAMTQGDNFASHFRAAMMLIFDASSEQIEQFFANLSERLAQAGVGDAIKTLEDGLVKAATMFEDALADAVISGKADFSDLADHLRNVLAKALIQKFVTGPIMGIFGLAKGGPAKAGQPYIVGEEGPELFVPKQSGTVVPNHALGNMSGGPQMGGGAVQNIYINAVDTQSFKTALARQDPEFIFALTQAGARRLPA